jgi:hypothetical protein
MLLDNLNVLDFFKRNAGFSRLVVCLGPKNTAAVSWYRWHAQSALHGRPRQSPLEPGRDMLQAVEVDGVGNE